MVSEFVSGGVEGGEDVVRCPFYVVCCPFFVVRWRRDGWEFGEGGDGAVDFVEDDFFDEGLWGGFGFGGFAGCCRCGAVGGGGVGAVGGVGAGLFGEEGGDDLEAVDEFAGAGGVEVVGGDSAEDLGGDLEGGDAVLDDGDGEGLGGVEVAELGAGGGGATGGVVVVAEMLVAEGGRAALMSGGVDVAAAEAGLGDGGEFLHGVSPLGGFVRKYSNESG